MKKVRSGSWLSLLLLSALTSTFYGCPNSSSGGGSDCPIVVVNFTPASGHVGDTVTITGQQLGGTDGKVGFSGAEATPATGSTDTMLVVQVPIGAQTAPITVDVPSRQNCQGASSASFTVLP